MPYPTTRAATRDDRSAGGSLMTLWMLFACWITMLALARSVKPQTALFSLGPLLEQEYPASTDSQKRRVASLAFEALDRSNVGAITELESYEVGCSVPT